MFGKGCFTNIPSGLPPQNGLMGWYDSNSGVFSDTSLSLWKDKTKFKNNLTPQSRSSTIYPAVIEITDLSNNQYLAIDTEGNVYIAESGNYVIRMYPKSNGSFFGQNMIGGSNYIIAGTFGIPGDDGYDDPATDAKIGYAYGITVDNNGSLYISDSGSGSTLGLQNNYKIRMVPRVDGLYFGTPMTSNFIYTIIGDGAQGFPVDGNLAVTSRLFNAFGLITDSLNNLIFCDGNAIRMIPQVDGSYWGIDMMANRVYTIVNSLNTDGGDPYLPGSVNGIRADLATMGPEVRSVVLDSTGNLAFTDSFNGLIKFMPKTDGEYYGESMTSNTVYLIAGGGGISSPFDCIPSAAQIIYPSHVGFSLNDTLIISIATDNLGVDESCITIIPRSNISLYGRSLLGNQLYNLIGTNGYLTQYLFPSVVSCVIDSQNSNIYATDNLATNLLSFNLTSIYTNINNYLFDNIYCYTTRPEFRLPPIGATIFAVWKPPYSLFVSRNLTQNLVTIFTDNIITPGNYSEHFTLSLVGSNNLSNFYIRVSDPSNTTSSSSYTSLTLDNYTDKNIINAICFNSNYLSQGSYARAYINGINVPVDGGRTGSL